MQTKSIGFDMSARTLHLFAMACMLLDHMWATVVPGRDWMTCAGRLAFPIFAFLLVEGCFHTSSLRRYAGRLAACALLSEIPFDLMYSGGAFFPFHQNVLWTLLLALLSVWLSEAVRRRTPAWVGVPAVVLIAAAAGLAASIAMTDYGAAGVLTVFAFYLFRGQGWRQRAGQLLALAWINFDLLGGLYYPISLFGREWMVAQQGFALLALVPLWLYRGRQGAHSKTFQYACYAFYPVHCLILGLLVRYALG